VLAIVCITALIALTLGLLAVSVEAIATPQFGVSTATHPPARLAPTSRPPTKNQPKGGATPVPTMTPVPNTQPADWVPMPLPPGWTNANLSTGDALEAERTAMTFTDREMSLDYRAVGTRGQHGGTLTASVFILTTAARQRFQQNDVRVVDTVLFDSVERSQLIQAVINGVPHLVQFQAQNQQQFAWVDVSFQLWQSQLDPQNAGQRLEGKNSDPATGQPRTHHMLVLLVRVPPGTQGANAPMGGTGWLVSNYALDAAAGALPMIVQPA